MDETIEEAQQAEQEPREVEEKAENLMGDKVKLHIHEDDLEKIRQYSVTEYGLCGYFSVTRSFEGEQEARDYFKAVQKVKGIDET